MSSSKSCCCRQLPVDDQVDHSGRLQMPTIGSKGVCQAPKMIHSRSGTGASNISTRRNPSFSSALLEAISKSAEDEAMKFMQGQDLKIISTSKSQKMEITRDPRLHIHTRSDEIDIFDAERYFSSWENGRARNPTSRGEESQVTGRTKHQEGQFSFQSGASDTCSEGSIAGANTPYWPFPSSEVEPGRLNRYGDAVFGSAEHKRSSSRNSHSLDYQARESTHTPRSRANHDGVLSDQSSVNATKASKDTRKPKQPTSPGSKLASFLNSLFIPAGAKKKKKKAKHSGSVGSNGGNDEDDGSACGSRGKIRYENPCSYSRSFSTDLGSRTPQSGITNSSTTSSVASWTISNSSQLSELYKSVMQENVGENVVKGYRLHHDSSSVDGSSYRHPYHHLPKLKSSFLNGHNRSNKNESNGLRRSVTFYPTSVILDENARPCGEKHLSRVDNPKNCNLPLLSKKLRLQLLDKGGAPSQYLIQHLDSHGNDSRRAKDSHDEENRDDVGSDSSSDLFELENFDAMDTGMYSRDLPVYETTHLETNQAIANGLL